LAFNIDMDLEPFGRINPCGYAGLVVTQLKAFSPLVFSEVEDRLVESIAGQLGYSEIIGPAVKRGADHGVSGVA
jgi:lipoyl(octanoyl) transferase